MDYRPAMPDDEQRRLRAHHEAAYESVRDEAGVDVNPHAVAAAAANAARNGVADRCTFRESRETVATRESRTTTYVAYRLTR